MMTSNAPATHSRLASLLIHGPRPIDNLLFLLASSSMILACPGDDTSPVGGGTSTGGVTTTVDSTGTTTAAVDSTGTTTTGLRTTGEPSSGDPTITASSTDSSGTVGSSGSSSGDPGGTGSGTGGLSASDVCPEFGAHIGECGSLTAEEGEMYCYGLYQAWAFTGDPDCIAAVLDMFACASTVDCGTLTMLGIEWGCPLETMALNDCKAPSP